jgi:raffinose/stachyose/melibiose transport system permease protein
MTTARVSRKGPSLIYAVPALALFGLFALVPMVIVVALSFMKWDGIGSPTWLGMANWQHIFADSVTMNALWLTVKLMAFSWLVQTPISILLGVFLAGKQRYRAVLAVVYFVPLLLSSAAIAVLYKSLLDPNFGLGAAARIPLLSKDWLGDPKLVFYVIVFVIAWQFMPFHALIYQSGVRQIPSSLYEAATLDGAGRVAQFRHITLPQLRYTIVTSSMLVLTGSLTSFDLVFVLTGGGPGYSTRLLPLDMYLTGFQSNDMGRASAISVLLVVFGLALSVILVRATGFGKMESQQEGA